MRRNIRDMEISKEKTSMRKERTKQKEQGLPKSK